MKIELNLPQGERQLEFIDYLNVAFRKRMTSSHGSREIDEDGSSESIVAGAFSVDQDIVNLLWRITKDSKGTLLAITCEAFDPQVGENKWKTYAYEFVTSILTTVLAAKREKYFQRSFFYYIGEQLDGEYWLPGYRFAPVYPDDPEPYLIRAERVVSIDQEVMAIDQNHASALAGERALRHAARLSLLLNIGLYRAEETSRWVWPVIEDKPVEKSERYQMGFYHPSARLTQMPNKGQRCSLGMYKGKLTEHSHYSGNLRSLPPETRKILRGIDQHINPKVTDAFDCGARLYQVAAVCGRYFSSVEMAYRVAAVEALCQADQTCKGFSDFMRKYITSEQQLDEVLEYLYGVARSAHFHEGRFPMGEFARDWSSFSPIMDDETAERKLLHLKCYKLPREAIVNWLIRVIPEITSADPDDSNLKTSTI